MRGLEPDDDSEFPRNSEVGIDNWSVTKRYKQIMIGKYVIMVQPTGDNSVGTVLVRTHDSILNINGLQSDSEHGMIKIIKDHLEPL